MSAPCCPHPVTRHAYNGCADCSCNVRWDQHPDREADPDFESILRMREAARLPSDELRTSTMSRS